jgi:hypothetical protein
MSGIKRAWQHFFGRFWSSAKIAAFWANFERRDNNYCNFQARGKRVKVSAGPETQP